MRLEVIYKKIPLHRKMFPGSNWHSLLVIHSNDPVQREKNVYTHFQTVRRKRVKNEANKKMIEEIMK